RQTHHEQTRIRRSLPPDDLLLLTRVYRRHPRERAVRNGFGKSPGSHGCQKLNSPENEICCPFVSSRSGPDVSREWRYSTPAENGPARQRSIPANMTFFSRAASPNAVTTSVSFG